MPRPTAIVMMDDDGRFQFEPHRHMDGPQGIIETYIHAGGRIGAMVELRCETDFVVRTDEFHALGREIAMQVAAMNPRTVGLMDRPDQDSDALLDQEYIPQLQQNHPRTHQRHCPEGGRKYIGCALCAF